MKPANNLDENTDISLSSDVELTHVINPITDKKSDKIRSTSIANLAQTISQESLKGDMTRYKFLKGPHIFDRIEPYFHWQNTIRKAGLWYFEKSSTTPPTTYCEGQNDRGEKIEGVNFASQDYLSLSSHPAIKAVAIQAIEEYGVHSAGSPALFGNNKFSLELENAISQHLQMEHIVLYPTGWGAGFGIITGLIRAKDHIVMDRLAHNCLQDGAQAATKNIHLFAHLDNNSVEEQLQKIRAEDVNNCILVITESLFSMDSDSPNLEELQLICHKYNAWLLVDIAHDLGALGENGQGVLQNQNMVGKIDLLIGSFSKTFATNGGFIGVNSRAVKEYLTFFSGPRAFSNALSPVQAAIASKAFAIVTSEEGADLRARLMDNILYLRQKLAELGLLAKGSPSPIVPIIIGDEGLTRIVTRLLIEKGVITNIVEFPGVAKREARLRIQVMANHTKAHIDELVYGVKEAIEEGNLLFQTIKDSSDPS